VIREIATRSHCPQCEGRGQRLVGELLTICDHCSGRGTLSMSDRKRAEAIGLDEAGYRRRWRPVYEWLLIRMQDAEIEAGRCLRAAASRDAA